MPMSAQRVMGPRIVSILVGENETFKGLLPGATIYSASVFLGHGDNRDSATTFAIVQAIDWMIENEVDVINFSLTGPHNPILEEAYCPGPSERNAAGCCDWQ